MKIASCSRRKLGAKSGNATASRSTFTKRQPSGPTAQISKISGKASSRDCARKCFAIRTALPTSASRDCTRRQAQRWSARRKFLIAYNINLNTPDIEIAKRIGKNIRFSNGGLRYVKAMGVDLRARNLAQVSINMTDFEQTPLHRVFEMVKREAERYGVSIVGSEIVGLIPKRAIELTADFYLQFENFSPAQVLENRLEASLGGAASEGPGRLAAMAQPFLDAVAQPTAAPGGGSVSALAGALGASLGQMVAGLSRKKKSQAAFVERLSEAVSEFHAAGQELAKAIDRDASSFESVMAAYKLPQGTPEEQQQA